MSAFSSQVSSSQSSQRALVLKSTEAISKQATKTIVISNKLEWRLERFERLMKLFKNGQSLVSKQFSSPEAPIVSWELHVYPNGKREEDSNTVSFFLRQVGLHGDLDPVITEFQIYALSENNGRVSVCRDIKDFSHQQGRGKFQVPREKLMVAIHTDGSLVLHCDLEFLRPGSMIDVEEQVKDSEKINEVSARAANREIFESKLFSDCQIQVGDTTFSAHRCILGQHSHVFRSMFAQTTMLEAQKGKITITDSRPEAVRAMLDFVYSATIDNTLMESFAQDILAIADKYAVMPLKERCETYLADSITNENVADIAVIADTYFALNLKKACTRCIAANHREISRSRGWQALKRNRSEFVNDLLESVLNDGDSGSGLHDLTAVSSINVETKKRRF